MTDRTCLASCWSVGPLRLNIDQIHEITETYSPAAKALVRVLISRALTVTPGIR
jgi:hypothetical protein